MGGSIDKNVLDGHPIDFNKDFTYFIEERYKVFCLKEAGQPRPWTQDPILHQYRFTNLFREDDATSRFIFDWVKPVLDNDELLLSNLIYARLCNKPSTMLATGLILDTFDPNKFIHIIDTLGGGKTKAKVNVNAVWKGPYQVAGTFVKLGYPYREQLIAFHIPKTAADITTAINSVKSNATLCSYLKVMNDIWGYKNNVVFTQVLLDLSYLKPNLIIPQVVVPMGSGVEPLVVALDIPYIELVDKAANIWNTLHPERPMMFKDAEHSLCEFRKYLCWKYKLSNPRHYKPSLKQKMEWLNEPSD
jgi:hypothetical protein